jgi:hypothetical protein
VGNPPASLSGGYIRNTALDDLFGGYFFFFGARLGAVVRLIQLCKRLPPSISQLKAMASIRFSMPVNPLKLCPQVLPHPNEDLGRLGDSAEPFGLTADLN